jgi:hypothetical protein
MPLEMLETNFKVVMQDVDICVLCELTISRILYFLIYHIYLIYSFTFFLFRKLNKYFFFNNLDIKSDFII